MFSSISATWSLSMSFKVLTLWANVRGNWTMLGAALVIADRRQVGHGAFGENVKPASEEGRT